MAMSSRRERPPSGRNNLRPLTAGPSSGRLPAGPNPHSQPVQQPSLQQVARPMSAAHTNRSLASNFSQGSIVAAESPSPMTLARPKTAAPARSRTPSVSDKPESSARSGQSFHTQQSELSTMEVLRRMREKSEAKKNVVDEAEIEALGDYNAFSRPKRSEVAPLRTAFLDPAVNNFPRSRTRTELMKRLRASGMPHRSYDLDNDGYVSQEDFRLAKRFDFDGNGLLDPDERNIGKQVLAEEFFTRHENDVANFGSGFANRTKKENIDKVVNAYNFERTYGQLMSVERTLKAESSKPLIDCIRNDTDPNFQRTKYVTNKFDSTAWTDYDRVPRSSWYTGPQGNEDHHGSRRRLLFSRRENARMECEERMLTPSMSSGTLSRTATSPSRRFGRQNLISDMRTENS